MENTIATINSIASLRRDLGVWEKFEKPEEDHSKASMEPAPTMKGISPFYHTSNMEYGRFQLLNRGFPTEGHPPGSQQGMGSQCNSKPQSRQGTGAAQPGDQQGLGGDGGHQEQERVPTAEEIAAWEKYMAASRRGERPNQAEEEAGEDTDSTGSKRLTTGYAGRWMTNNCNRFWNNIQDVAPMAGYDTSSRPPPAGSAAQILTVGHEGAPGTPGAGGC